MAESRQEGEDMSTDSLHCEVYKACYRAQSNLDPFYVVLRRGHGRAINLAPLYDNEF